MITSVNNLHSGDIRPAQHPVAPAPQPQAQTPRSGALSDDQVTLKSAGQPDHDVSKK